MWKQNRRDLGYTVVVQWLSHILLFRPHGLQHTRPPCPSPSHRTCSNSCQYSQWCHPTHLIFWHPLLLLPSILPSIRVFSNKSVLYHRWSFSFSIRASKEYSGLIFFRIDWFDLLAFIPTNNRKVSHLLLFPSQQVTKKYCSLIFYPYICFLRVYFI